MLFQSGKGDEANDMLTGWANDNAKHLLNQWWELFFLLITKYHDNQRMNNLTDDRIVPEAMFFPLWWLEETGYFPRNVTVQLQKDYPDSSNASSSTLSPFSVSASQMGPIMEQSASFSGFMVTISFSLLSFFAGAIWYHTIWGGVARRKHYEPI